MATSDSHLSKLLSSSVLIVVGVVVASVGRLIERIIIAHWFSPQLYGEVTIALAIMTIGTTISLVGLNDGIPRFVSRYDDDQDVRGVWLFGLGFALAVSLAVSLVLYLNVNRIAIALFETDVARELLRLFVLTIPVSVGLTVGVSALRGMENTRYKLYTKDFLHPCLRIVLLVALVAGGFDLVSVGYAYFAATLATLLVVYLLSNRLVRLVGPVRTHTRELLTYSAPLIVTMVLSILLTRMDTLMLAQFRTSNEVGVYNAAYPLANSLLMVISSFGYLYLPLTSRLDAEGEREEVTSIYRITTKWIYVLTFPAFLVFTVFPDDVLSLFFGSGYTGGGIVLALLSVGFFTSAAAGRNRTTLAALGHTKAILGVDILTLALNFAVNLLLIPTYGMVGAAVASSGAYVVRNLALNVVLLTKCGITPFSAYTNRTYVVLPLVLFPVGLLAGRWLTLSLLTLPVFLVCTGLVGLAAVTVAGGLQPEDGAFIEFIEGALGVEVPAIQRYVPMQGE
ncbi:polysaccharide biosynthesis protein [Haladaptatus sp. W1]|uniref:flippase n=1 Tax=Haladaptatus sp. W1 TaxID=1897478 RepID=UPI00084997E7|nr:flippase [Haladaptatus sp. W1]ODR81951.1 polysaccharide biosynthesis protein [Haladaptatus sp. W1]